MAKLVATVKAILTRVVFGAHGFLAIWQVTLFKHNPFFWYLCTPILVLVFEGIFTLTIKKTQEWKWFCPSVFLYLGSVVPAIWLLELDKVERRLKAREESSTVNLTAVVGGNLKELDKLFGVQLKLPTLDTDTWVTLIEQFLMLVLIIGRWMLPKGDLTRDQLSQLLLVYIGTAADIIEFFDSFKDDTIAQEPVLVLLTLAIWSWSLLQFTVVLTATKSRKSRLSTTTNLPPQRCYSSCCTIDVWGIVLNILLQDAPFFAFRLLLILHYRIISYMNVFFTCKNTLVIVLQLYRLYVVQAEARKLRKASSGRTKTNSVAVVSEQYRLRTRHSVDDLISVVSNSPPSPLDDIDDDELELTLAELQAVRRSRRADVRPRKRRDDEDDRT
ncbi:transmembrane protein 26 [Anabrus simplex]|uniref:transmembrane protein 26 n=1 Tax=Anabrus simplex TaxID=316456 RepID=UPI0035A27C18